MRRYKEILTILITVCISSSLFAQGLDSAFEISTSGIIAQKVKLNMVAQNIANVSTLKDEATGLPYQKRYVLLEPTAKGVRVKSIEKSQEPFLKYFDPAVPQADENGYFYYSNVNLPEEMVNLTYTESIFEANIASFKTTKAIYQNMIDVLK